jgi:transglutaminase-like putative cysteine protease
MNWLTALIALLSFAHAAYAQDAPADSSVRLVREHIDYDVNIDGTATVTAELALSATTRNALGQVSQRTISYQEGMSEIELIEMYTLKADGKRIDVAPSGVVVQVPPAYANAAMYADMKIKRIIFPDVSVGDQVVYKYKRHVRTPLFPGYYFDSQVFPKSVFHDDVRITVRHARAHQLHFHARELRALPSSSTETHITHEWRFTHAQPTPEEPGSISNFDRDPVFELSSFQDWSEIANAYDARARDKAAVTPAIQKMADQIIGKTKDRRRQAVLIHAWVAANIRYVAIYLGAGGYVPHTADSILANRYGDCKDYVTLTQALLAAKGIAGMPVIINASNRFRVPSITTPTLFNHAILYLPEFKSYLDPTARTLAFGMLSIFEANKPVLHTRDFKGLLYTPGIVAETNTFNSDSTIEVGSDGSITGTTVVIGKDVAAAQMRQIIGRLEDPQYTKQYATALLSVEGLTGTSSFTTQNGGSSAGYTTAFTIHNWLNLPGPGAVRLPTGILGASSIRLAALQNLNQRAWTIDRMCIPGQFIETSTIKLPLSVTPNNIPEDVEIANAVANYRAAYSREGNIIKISRTLTIGDTNTICTPENSAQAREIFEHVRRDTSAQMTYE